MFLKGYHFIEKLRKESNGKIARRYAKNEIRKVGIK
jgi:hypothetical protein